MTSGICDTPFEGCLHKMLYLNFTPVDIIAGALFYIFAPWKYTSQLTLFVPVLFHKLAEFLAVYDGNFFEVPNNPKMVNEWHESFRRLKLKQDVNSVTEASRDHWNKHYVESYFNGVPRIPASLRRPTLPEPGVLMSASSPSSSRDRSVIVTDAYVDDLVLMDIEPSRRSTPDSRNAWSPPTQGDTTDSSSSS